MRRIWYWLRDVVWTAVLSVALVVCAVTLTLLGYESLGLVSALGAIPFALLAIRS